MGAGCRVHLLAVVAGPVFGATSPAIKSASGAAALLWLSCDAASMPGRTQIRTRSAQGPNQPAAMWQKTQGDGDVQDDTAGSDFFSSHGCGCG